MRSDLPEPEPTDDDDALVVRAKSDRAAFGELFDRYYPRVWRYCVRRLGDRTCAEDVTSEAFLNVASHLATFPGRTESDFRAWLFRIATNGVLAHVRQKQRRKELWNTAAATGRLAAEREGASGELTNTEVDWQTVCTALRQLPEREQTIVSLRFFAGCSHEEIASVVGMSAGAVRTALSRTIAKLRQTLSPPIRDAGDRLSR
jgi:RNA polymerase sigma-70 factor (ECF subfamily)